VIRAAAAGIAAGIALLAAPMPGSVDPTFGTNGVVVTPMTQGNWRAIATELDSALWVRGRLWLSGASKGPGPWKRVAPHGRGRATRLLLRYLPNGKLDPSFGQKGILVRGPWDYFDGDATILQLALPDGSVIATRGLEQVYNKFTIAVTRLRPDGSIDPSFGHHGVARVLSGTCEQFPTHFVRQPDGKLVAIVVPCGQERKTGNRFALARLTANGRLDSSFGTRGIATARIAPGNSDFTEATSLVLLPDGRLLEAGTTGDGSDSQAILARFNSDGSLDRTFADDGVAAFGDPCPASVAEPLVRPNGDIVVSVCEDQSYHQHVVLYRFDSTGALVESFGHGGSLTIRRANLDAFDVPLLGDRAGKIILVGSGHIVRIGDDGAVDTSFGDEGFVEFARKPYDKSLVLLQPDGKILYVGKVRQSETQRGFALERFLD
jgi:uncharacterized delta-60 repeat protein